MKLPAVLLAAITVAVISSCKKGEEITPAGSTQQPSDVIGNNNNGSNGNNNGYPYCCPGCGMG